MYFVSELAGDELVLGGEEGHHALGPRRVRAGDRVELFDGQGTVALAHVEGIDRRKRELRLRVSVRTRQAPPLPLVLACALPKGERVTTMLDMCTQLGMTAFVPLDCERAVTRAGANAQVRWQRVCVEACKQSRRAWLPQLLPAAAPGAVMGAGSAAWLAEPDGPPAASLAAQCADASAHLVIVGPEGGLTADERDLLRAGGARPVSFGRGILRVETAAVTALGWCAVNAAGDVPG